METHSRAAQQGRDSAASDAQPSEHHDQGRMGMRGVTRPMAERQFHQQGAETDHPHDASHDERGGGHHMDPQQRHHMLHRHHQQTLWIYWLLVLLGVWTMLSPLTFGYATATVVPSGGRDIWLSLATRIALMTWSDLLSGLLLIIFGWRALTPNRPVSLWICCGVGV